MKIKLSLIDAATTLLYKPAFILLVLMLQAACNTGGLDDVIKSNADSEEDLDTDTYTDTDTSEQDEKPYTAALIITTDYVTGSYSTISVSERVVKKDIAAIHSDAVCRFDPLTNTPFVINRSGGDSISVLDSNTCEIKKDYSTEALSNPSDIAVYSKNKAYISRYGLAEMLVVEPLNGKEVGLIDLSDYADADGIPEVSGLALTGDTLYVPVQRIDQNVWQPEGSSFIVIIDSETGDIDGDIKLTGTNPYGAPEYSKALKQFVIAETGSWSELDGGIELFDPETEEVSGFIITEKELNGNVSKGIILSETKGYALVGVSGDSGSESHIIIFNPKTGKVTKTLIEDKGWSFTDMVLTPNGDELWITDRTAEKSGIRIFSTETDEEITENPINVGLPPSAICFTRQ